MNCKYDNSMYCTIPPEPIAYEILPEEAFEDAVAEHNFEEQDFLSYVDIDELRDLELIKNAK